MPSNDDILIDSLRYYCNHALDTGNALVNERASRLLINARDIAGARHMSDARKVELLTEKLDDLHLEYAKARKSLNSQRKQFLKCMPNAGVITLDPTPSKILTVSEKGESNA